MIQIVLVGLGSWRGGGAPVCFRRLGIACGGLPVLSRAAADHDRRARLEPPGRADRGGLGHRGRSRILSGVFLIAVPVIAFGAWWLGYLALLARPATNGGGDALEWYPVGRLVLWAAVIGTLIVAAAVPNFGTDQESLQAALRKTYERILRDQALIDVLVVAVPPAAAIFSTITNVFNLWLAARVVKISGRLKRPWPDLAALALPPSSSALLAAAIAGSFLPDLAGVLSGVFAASLLMAFAILGFAVLHAITRGMRARIVMLTGLYAAAVVFGWPVLAVALLGLAESILNIRSRVARKRGPPSLRT